MGNTNFINIVNILKEDAKEELPIYPGKFFYKSISFLYAAIFDIGSFSTSCSSSILINANECFMLVSGLNCFESYSHILYYIDDNGIPHKEGFIDGRWSIVTRNIRFGVNPYHYGDALFLNFDDVEIARSKELNKTCENVFKDIVGKYLAIRHCKTLEEVKLSAKVLEMDKEMQSNKNMTDFIKAYLSEEIQMYKDILSKINK